MNGHTVCLALVATLGATLALASTTASAGKPPPPPPPDPCASVDPSGFPSFVFVKNITVKGATQQTWGMFVADKTGQCQKSVGTEIGGKSVNMRYDAATGLALLVKIGIGYTLVGATVPISSPTGTQAPATFNTLLTGSQLQAMSDPGWGTLSSMGDASLPVSGSQMLFTAVYGSGANTQTVFWRCDLAIGPSGPSIADPATACKEAFRLPINVAYTDASPAAWSATAGTFYVIAPASSGVGRSLYRYDTTTMPPTRTELWSRGTVLGEAAAFIDKSGKEWVAVTQWSATSYCMTVFVIDPSTCAGGDSCQIQNGLGAPARWMTWLPDGRLAANGQAGPDRKGMCAEAGSIVSFGATDTNGSATTIVTHGSWPDGAGGG
jgi:hypothetical protein